MACNILALSMALEEYRGMYSREMQVFAVGKWLSSAGLTVTLGIGWNPSSDAGRAGLEVQKYTYNKIIVPKSLMAVVNQGLH